jgi:dTMP kinase
VLITFEGLDFCGKSTQAALFEERLRPVVSPRGVRFIREPGSTKLSERIRAILLDNRNNELGPVTEALLFSSSRSQLVHEVIQPALARGEVVVCDRYYDSTTAYQGHGRKLDLDAVRTINRFATSAIVPALTIFIDIPVEDIERRKKAAGLSFDRMEREGREFFERVRNGYMAIVKSEPHRVVRVDGRGTVEKVRENVWEIVKERLPELVATPGVTSRS